MAAYRMTSVFGRTSAAIIAGIIAGVLVGVFISWKYTPLAVWDGAATVFIVWIWLSIRGSTAEKTAALAVQEDPGRAGTDIVLLLASVASIGAVIVVLVQASNASGLTQIAEAAFAMVSIIISWTTIHTIYTLRYAEMFYKRSSGVDFNTQSKPKYSDFAYLAFTIGMTFQVSDNEFKTNEFRRIALRHAMLSYVFGTVIVASTINVIAGLGK